MKIGTKYEIVLCQEGGLSLVTHVTSVSLYRTKTRLAGNCTVEASLQYSFAVFMLLHMLTVIFH